MVSLIDLMSSIDPDFNPQQKSIDYREFTEPYQQWHYVGRHSDKPMHGVDIYSNPKWLQDIYDAHWSGQVFKKVSDWPTHIDPREEGIKGLKESESRNAQTNFKLNPIFEGRVDLPYELFQLIHRTKLIIADIVGEIYPRDIGARFTTGATTDFKSGRNIIESVSPLATCTPKLHEYLTLYGFGQPAITGIYSYVSERRDFVPTVYRNPWITYWVEDTDSMWRPEPKVIYGLSDTAKFFFIPKQWDKGRNGFTSPTVNMAVGSHYSDILVQRLKAKTGIDIDNATQKHWQLARRGSIDHSYITIDKKGGSDHIAYSLINLFPKSHREILDALRIEYYTVDDGDKVKFNMLGHQGATYTFIIETIIFYALAKACGFEEVHVFGDDTIIKTNPEDPRIQLYFKYADFMGVIINKEKSLYERSYSRESCGGDYVHGISVRPYYFKSIELKSIDEIHKALNGIYDRYYDPIHRRWVDSRFKQLWHLLFKSINKDCVDDDYQSIIDVYDTLPSDSNGEPIYNESFDKLLNRDYPQYIGPYASGEEVISYADDNYWSYTSPKRDKVFSITPRKSGEKTSLFLSLDPSRIRGKKRSLYELYHENILTAVLHNTAKGMSSDNKYADFIRVDDYKVYTESSIKFGAYVDEPMDFLSNHKVFDNGRFVPLFKSLDCRIKEKSALAFLESRKEHQAVITKLLGILELRKKQLEIVVDW